ncbi:MAG: LuxR family transcriptional regulator [Frankiales bacterium]|nr:LuxR family transcriptional regulator [Frankiales bacterium]
MSEPVTRVVLVEDDPTIRSVIEILLATEPDLELVGSAASAEEGIELVRRETPDLLLLDNQLEGRLSGVAAAPAFKAAFPAVLVLLCTALDLAGLAASADDIDGYLRKDRLAELADVARALIAESRRP